MNVYSSLLKGPGDEPKWRGHTWAVNLQIFDNNHNNKRIVNFYVELLQETYVRPYKIFLHE